MEQEDLPCPFCGKTEDLSLITVNDGFPTDYKPRHYVACHNCGMTGPDKFQTIGEIRKAWNTRATDLGLVRRVARDGWDASVSAHSWYHESGFDSWLELYVLDEGYKPKEPAKGD